MALKSPDERAGRPWTDNEIEIIVGAYFRMLLWQLLGFEFSKSDVRNSIKGRLPARSDKSIDFKWCNVSSVLAEMDLPWLEGFKPLPHLQESLRLAVHGWLDPGSMSGSDPAFDGR